MKSNIRWAIRRRGPTADDDMWLRWVGGYVWTDEWDERALFSTIEEARVLLCAEKRFMDPRRVTFKLVRVVRRVRA